MALRELFLDTTYILPFFYININVKGFSRNVYKSVIQSLQTIHISDVSIIEAKAKSLRLRGNRSGIAEKFNIGLSVLSCDEKVVIHGYSAIDDKNFNKLQPFGLDFFDRMILAQSCTVGTLLTEDSKLMHLSDTSVTIINWENLISDLGISQGH